MARERRKEPLSKERLRNLTQYKNMSDEDFDRMWAEKEAGFWRDNAWELRINHVMKEYQESYDLDSLMPNDLSTLRALIQAVIRLEDFEQEINKLSAPNKENPEETLGEASLYKIKQLSEMCNALRKDIASMQDVLKISRKTRKSETEESVINFIANLKDKAHKFAEQKMHLVFCPKCHLLLAQIWWLYPDKGGNKIILKCHRELDGEKCTGMVELSSKELVANGGRNYDNIPETIK